MSETKNKESTKQLVAADETIIIAQCSEKEICNKTGSR